MRWTLLFCTVVVTQAWAKPNGHYHQEYNYRTSSSSYRNNELQHQNADEGFYSKDGDLAGRLQPKVNAHSQHSEYVNPKYRDQLTYGNTGVGGQTASSFGQLNARSNFDQGSSYGGAAGFSYSGSQIHGGMQQGSYGVHSNLNQITRDVQDQLARQIQNAIHSQYSSSSSYGRPQYDSDLRILEEQLRRNITIGLEEALRSRYGSQGVKGGMSYSLTNGRLQPTANYDNRELQDLTRQIETNLVRQLEDGMRTQYQTSHQFSSSSMSTHQTTGNTYPIYNRNNFPAPIPAPAPAPVTYPHQPLPDYGPVVSHPDSLTTIATRVQNDLNQHLNIILDDTRKRYFSPGSYEAHNWQSILSRLENDLRFNVTHQFDLQMRKIYGDRTNFKVQDVEDLKRQVENNLIQKLTRDFTSQKDNYFRTVSTSSSSSGISTIYQNQPYQPAASVPRGNFGDNYVGTSQISQVEWANIQRQLQDNLSRQLQGALNQQQYQQGHTTYGSYNPQSNYQATLQQLQAELNRNLTRQMELSMARYQSYGGGYASNNAYETQLALMKNQLQNNLNRQLQDGLQQSYSSHSSWSSSSSSSSNYRPVRGSSYTSSGNINSMGEDCMMGDDPSTYNDQTEDDYSQVEDHDLSQHQLDDHDDLTQQIQQEDFGQQQLEDDDLSQKLVPEDFGQHSESFPNSYSKPKPQQISYGGYKPGSSSSYQRPENPRTLLTTSSHPSSQPFSSSLTKPENQRTSSHPGTQTYTTISKKFYITDSSGHRREVDEATFRKQLESFQIGSSTHRYYISDDLGHDAEIQPGHYSEVDRYFKQWKQTIRVGHNTETSRRYFITDSSGVRREVDEAEYRKVFGDDQEQDQDRLSKYTTQVSKKYYIIDSSGQRREVDEAEYQRFLSTHSDSDEGYRTQTTRRYYITDSSGSRREVSEDEYKRFMEDSDDNIRTTTTIYKIKITRQYFILRNSKYEAVDETEFLRELKKPGYNKKFYIADGSGHDTEIRPNQQAEIEHYFQQWQQDLDQNINHFTKPSTNVNEIHEITKKFYIIDSYGVRREIDEQEFRKQLQILKFAPQSSTKTYRYYISDGRNHETEVLPSQLGQIERHFYNWQQIPEEVTEDLTHKQVDVTQTTHLIKKYYITDSRGVRREVSETEFRRELAKFHSIPGSKQAPKYYIGDNWGHETEIQPGQEVKIEYYFQLWEQISHQPTQEPPYTIRGKYYIIDHDGTRREISETEYRRILANNPFLVNLKPGSDINHSHTVTTVTRKYYIIDSNGKQQEVSEAQFKQYLENPTVYTTTRKIQKYYFTDSSGHRTELRPGQSDLETYFPHIEDVEPIDQDNLEQKPQKLDSDNHLGQGPVDVGQELDDSDLEQKPQQPIYIRPSVTEPIESSLGASRQYESSGYLEQKPQRPGFRRPESSIIRNYIPPKRYESQNPIGQEIDDSEDLVQKPQRPGLGQPESSIISDSKPPKRYETQNPIGQQIDDSEDLVQKPQKPLFGQQTRPNKPKHTEIGQEIDDSDLGQQVEVGQQIDNSDFYPQRPNNEFGHFQIGSQQQIDSQDIPGQQTDDSDLTQQVEEDGFGNFQVGQEPDDSDLTQKPERPNPLGTYNYAVSKPVYVRPKTTPKPHSQLSTGEEDHQIRTQTHYLNPQRPVDLTQQVEDTHINYQSNYGRPQSPPRPSSSIYHQQQTEDIEDLGQQEIETPDSHRSKPASSDLTGQTQLGYDSAERLSQQLIEQLRRKQQQKATDFETDTQQQIGAGSAPTSPTYNTQYSHTRHHSYSSHRSYGYRSSYGTNSDDDDSDLEQEPQPARVSSSYGTPSSSYGTPSSSHRALGSSYSALSPSYGAPSSSYDDSDLEQKPQPARVSSSYGAPSSSSGTPSSSYSALGSGYSALSSSSGTPSSSYGSAPQGRTSYGQSTNQYSSQVHYGTPRQVSENVETVEDIPHIEPQKAHVVQSVDGGIKTKGQVDVTEDPAEDVTEPVPTEKPGFWSRLGNKMKDKAQSIKASIG